LFVLDNITAVEELTPDVHRLRFPRVLDPASPDSRAPARSGIAPTRFTTPNAPAGAVIDYYLKAALDTARPVRKGGERGRARAGA